MPGEEPADDESPRWQRWWQRLIAAGRWTIDVLRGHAWSRHLDHNEK